MERSECRWGVRARVSGMMEVNQVSILDRHPTPAQYHIFPSPEVYWSASCPKVQSGPPEIGGWLTLGNMQTPSSQMGPYRLRLSPPLILSALA